MLWLLRHWDSTRATARTLAFSKSGNLLAVGHSFLFPAEPAVVLWNVQKL